MGSEDRSGDGGGAQVAGDLPPSSSGGPAPAWCVGIWDLHVPGVGVVGTWLGEGCVCTCSGDSVTAGGRPGLGGLPNPDLSLPRDREALLPSREECCVALSPGVAD